MSTEIRGKMARKTPVHTFVLLCGHPHHSFINSDTFEFRCADCGGERIRKDPSYPVSSHIPGVDAAQVKKDRSQARYQSDFQVL